MKRNAPQLLPRPVPLTKGTMENMKKHLLLVLALVMCIALTACKSDAAKSADGLIAAIGEVTLDSESRIIEAENAVAALEEKDRSQIENEQLLLDARSQYDELVKDRAANEISAAISAVGKVTLDSEPRITAARELYDGSDADVQKRVANYSELLAAEEALAGLKAQEVIARIDEIGEVSLQSEEKITAVKDAYDSLPAAAKSRVTNAEALETAVQTIETLKAEAKEKARQEAFSKLKTETDKVEGITWYQSKNEPTYINTSSFVLPYIGQNSSGTWLRLKCNYTGDDWVFFTKITFLVDGEKYTKYFDYFDVERDNDHGDVWEVADFAPGDADIKMLEAIADSSETIVRFEGDSKYYDLTIKSADKQGIKDVLAAYEFVK